MWSEAEVLTCRCGVLGPRLDDRLRLWHQEHISQEHIPTVNQLSVSEGRIDVHTPSIGENDTWVRACRIRRSAPRLRARARRAQGRRARTV